MRCAFDLQVTAKVRAEENAKAELLRQRKEDMARTARTIDFCERLGKELEKKAESDPQQVLCELRDLHINGLGTVYIITLLYFISHGQYPIYDRFAWKAIQAICDDTKPGDVIHASELPEKKSHAFDTVFDTYMNPYMDKLKSVFGSTYQESRDIDRALWVYGHKF